jgi:hypothetical protein
MMFKHTRFTEILSILPGAAQIVALVGILSFYAIHCVWVSAEMYSAPSIVLQSRRPDGSVHVFDDFREAYAWLRHNTNDDAKVAYVEMLMYAAVYGDSNLSDCMCCVPGCKLVGLWLPNDSYGQSNCTCSASL